MDRQSQLIFIRSIFNNIAMFSKHNERKSIAAERFIRTLRNKI